MAGPPNVTRLTAPSGVLTPQQPQEGLPVPLDTKKYFELPVSTVGQAVGFAIAVLVVIAVARMLPLPKIIKP